MQVRYSRSDIEAWKSKLGSLPNEIRSLEKFVEDRNSILIDHKRQFNKLIETQIQPEQTLLEQIIAKIDLLTLPEQIPALKIRLFQLSSQIEGLSGTISQTENLIQPIKREMTQIELWMSIKGIQSSIHELEGKISSLMSSREQYEGVLRTARRELEDANRAYTHIQVEVEMLEGKRLQISREIRALKQARDEVHSAPMGYSSTANQGYSSSGSGVDSSGFESSVSSVVHSTNTDLVIADYNNKISVKELARHDVEEQKREREYPYSQARTRLNEAQSRVTNVEEKINTLNRDIHSSENNFNSFKSQLNAFEYKDKEYAGANAFAFFADRLNYQKNILMPIESRLVTLSNERNSLIRGHGSLSDSISGLENRIKMCEKITKTFSSTDSLDQLRKRRAEQENLLIVLNGEKENLGKEIAAFEREKVSNVRKIQQLFSELSEKRSNQYLNHLENNPVSLLNKLALSAYQGLQLFDLQNSYHQSVTVRKCLTELNYKMAYMLPQHRLPINANEMDATAARQQYYLMCGLLQYELTTLNAQTDGALEQLIKNLLHEHLISLGEARLEYCEYESNHPVELASITDALLLQTEMQAFEAMRNDFKVSMERLKLSASPELRKVRELGESLLTRIDSKRKESQKDQAEPFDYKYYSSLLACGNKLLIAKPDDPNYTVYRQSFQQLASHHPNDRPSVWNKIGGVALMFFGAVIAAAGALALVFSFPFVAPLSYYVAAPVIAAGVGVILGGIGLFRRGCHSGFQEKVRELDSLLERTRGQASINIDPAAEKLLDGPGSYGAGMPPVPAPSAPALER